MYVERDITKNAYNHDHLNMDQYGDFPNWATPKSSKSGHVSQGNHREKPLAATALQVFQKTRKMVGSIVTFQILETSWSIGSSSHDGQQLKGVLPSIAFDQEKDRIGHKKDEQISRVHVPKGGNTGHMSCVIHIGTLILLAFHHTPSLLYINIHHVP